jgi:leucine dehydrogenase
LENDRHGEILHRKNILYAPDFVIGAGGLINVVNELEGYHQERALKQARGIYEILSRVLNLSEKENIPPHQAANLLAEERINLVKKFKQRVKEGGSCN